MVSTVIITGASRGIGLAAAQFLLAGGANVVTVQRTTSPDLTTLLKKYPKTLHNIQGDFTAEEVISRAIRESLEAFGTIDALVFNAAAASAVGRVDNASLADWQKTFDVNVFGVVKFLKEAIPTLKDGAKIIFVSSAASENSLPGAGAYGASKAALNSLNRTVAAEHPNLTCVSLHPGVVRTEMHLGFMDQAKDFLREAKLDGVFVESVLEPDVPGRIIANLALHAPKELSGKYLRWNDPDLASL
ncbi:NAD(P)-binding protein [Auricularia subglabra TFB-10046 SS5]|nr:NAD(P)-binding protein [Auricularia subglabra TFB-10046 SS5]